MVQYLDKFMDMCIVKVMPCEEKSQKRVVEHSVNNLKEVLTILSVSMQTQTLQRVNVHQQRHRVQTVLRRRVFSRTMLSKVRTAREMQFVGKSKSELMKVIDKLLRVNLNSVVEILITVINVAVSSSVDRQKLLVIVQSRQSGDDDDSWLSALAGAVTLR